MRDMRGWMIWAALGLCALLVLGTVTVMSYNVMQSERRRAYVENQLDLLVNVRSALLRIDIAAASWITDETQRTIIPTDQPDSSKPEVWLRFEAREDGELMTENREICADLERRLTIDPQETNLFAKLSAAMPLVPPAWSNPPSAPDAQIVVANDKAQQRENPAYQQSASVKDYAWRAKAVNRAVETNTKPADGAVNNWEIQSKVPYSSDPFAPGQNAYPSKTQVSSFSANWQLLQSGVPRPVRIDGQLFLLRHLRWRMPDGQVVRSIQGSWIDDAALRAELVKEVGDLFPAGRLINAKPQSVNNGLTLTSFPYWELDTGVTVDANMPMSRTFWLTLGAGWISASLALSGAFLLVNGVMRLSERRASFVSAVTHELRTPLTTFRLYSEMLESGAVREEKRSSYLKILSREADRLAHLVENVLAFSRIERGSARAAVRETTARELLEPLRERFEARLLTAGMELRMNLQTPSAETLVKVDAASVEHILFNLVDNAAKYASSGQPPELTIGLVAKTETLDIYVEDNGPGIPPGKRARIFQPFHKSARDAAESKPGVGLGLALSRRLARSMGRDLEYKAPPPGKTGACFILHLPLS